MSLSLPSTVSISEVATLRETLRAALDAGDLELDVSAVTEIDTAGLQLLESAHRTALARGRAFRFSRGGRGAVDSAAASLGLRLAEDPTRWREVRRG